MGGYGGAAVAHAGFKALILGGWVKPVLFIFLSPIIGMLVAIIVTIITSWIVRKQRPQKVDKWFRRLQLLSAALLQPRPRHQRRAKRHGHHYGSAGRRRTSRGNFDVPYWVIICCHLAMGGGTMAGGWRIIKTMGQRITKLTPFGGFAAETAGALTLVGTARFRHSRQHHAHDHRRHRRRRRLAPPLRRPLGRHPPHRLGLGPDHSRRRPDRRRYVSFSYAGPSLTSWTTQLIISSPSFMGAFTVRGP